jgi:hypothetical protein
MSLTFTRSVTDIPSDHFDVDENPDTIPKDQEVCGMIDNLIQEYKFAKNFGPCRIISHLRSKGIEEGRIPTAKQLQNRLYYFRKCKLQFGNEIDPLEKNCKALSTSMNSATNTPLINHSHFIMVLIRMIALSWGSVLMTIHSSLVYHQRLCCQWCRWQCLAGCLQCCTWTALSSAMTMRFPSSSSG